MLFIIKYDEDEDDGDHGGIIYIVFSFYWTYNVDGTYLCGMSVIQLFSII